MIWQQQRRHARPPIAAPPAVPSPALVPRPEVLTTATPRAATPSVSATPFPTVAAQLPPGLKLIIPVAGIRSAQLRDTFSEARSEGREHNAIDIMAPAGAPVLAAADGKLVKLFNSERGGLTLYQLSNDQRVVFYYAHLQRYAEGLTVGQALRQGDTIAYVGDTGNAGAGNYHLHFAVWLIQDARHFWDGLNLNPYSLLKEGS
ncbi:MAG: M23 family metallopeptidase [Acidobacteria bacterium]|nr:M23 family metallopeptidase [Acidobacteriota bacterium]MBI3428425.1 M23 family metallopeptidase [Acidobacteriota bacterium]